MSARDELLAIPDELLRTGRIGQAVMVFMDFRDTPRRWWTGFGDLDHAGHRWQGTEDFISISKISTAYNTSARKVTFELSATAEMLANALGAKDRVRDRAVTVSVQLFALDGTVASDRGVEFGEPIGAPMALFSGTMQRMPWTITGVMRRTIKLEAEGLFFRRNAAPRGRWSDTDQRMRYPGDRGFERLPLYSNGYETKWRG